MPFDLKVGDTIWEFNQNWPRRDERGRVLFESYFRPAKIIGETNRSWIVDNAKIPKNSSEAIVVVPCGKYEVTYYLADKARLDSIWRYEHHYKLEEALRQCRDVDLLKKVAEALGYQY